MVQGVGDVGTTARSKHREGIQLIEGVLGRGATQVLGLYLFTATTKMLAEVRGDPELRKITPHVIGTPSIISQRPGISQSELARYLGCPRATAGKQIKVCLRLGWVRRRRSATDRRSYVLDLTVAGQRMLDDVSGIVMRHEDRAFAGLAAGERRMLRGLLLKFILSKLD